MCFISGLLCSIFGWLCSISGWLCSIFGWLCSIFGWLCSIPGSLCSIFDVRFPLFLDLFSRSAGSLLFNMSVKMGQIKPSSPFLAHFHFRFTARLIELGYLGVTLSKKAKSSDVLRKSGKLSPWGLFSGGLQKLSQSGHQVGRFGHRVCESQQKCADYNTFLPPDAQKCSGEGLATRRWFQNPPPCT